jgi:hypothetical protein
MASVFNDIINDPPIEVFEVTRSFNEDKHPNKVNLGVGGKFEMSLKKDAVFPRLFIL